MHHRAFVDMPYGRKKVVDPERKLEFDINFDDVYERLLQPALALARCIPFRGSESSHPGDIRDDMFFELVMADVVLADVSMHNPNVFYELGVRHAASPRGAIMVDGGWARAPFDTQQDRLIRYDGTLFEGDPPRWTGDGAALAREVDRLATRVRAALETTPGVVGSPVYSHLPGLEPPDARGVKAGKASYFVGQVERLDDLIETARRASRPGDIVTLAESMPVPFQRDRTMLAAAKALISGRHHRPARRVLERLLEISPAHFDARCLYGMVLNRLGERDKARTVLDRLAKQYRHHPEVQGMLGRVHKDAWRSAWEAEPDLASRQAKAMKHFYTARAAFDSYSTAFGADRSSYYNGINAVGLAAALRHLDEIDKPFATPIDAHEFRWIFTATHKAAKDMKAQAGADDPFHHGIWSRATLAELALLGDDTAEVETAPAKYVEALSAGADEFEADSMVTQLRLYEWLGFRPEAVRACVKIVGPRLVKERQPFRTVAVGSGHMVDVRSRPRPRFPASRVDFVRERIAAAIDEWTPRFGPGDLAICGGARGADLIFAELCLERGAKVRLLASLPWPEFRDQSLRLDDDHSWEHKFDTLRDRGAEVWNRLEHLGEAPSWMSPFEQTNAWILNTALAEAAERIQAVVVWNGEGVGDGPGGTADFVSQLGRLVGRAPTIIDPRPTA